MTTTTKATKTPASSTGAAKAHTTSTKKAPAKKAPAKKAPAKAQASEASPTCKCGCGNPTKATYAPGHDARHVSLVLEMVGNGRDPLNPEDYDAAIEVAQAHLESPALVAKFQAAFSSRQAKAQARAAKKAAKA